MPFGSNHAGAAVAANEFPVKKASRSADNYSCNCQFVMVKPGDHKFGRKDAELMGKKCDKEYKNRNQLVTFI